MKSQFRLKAKAQTIQNPKGGNGAGRKPAPTIMTVAKFRKGDLALKIYQDEDAQSPREWDNLGIMTCWNRRYSLGDKHRYPGPDDFWYSLAEEIVGDTDKVEAMSGEKRRQVVQEQIIILPLYLYDHSGLSISTSSFGDPWDSGQIGWIYVAKESVRQEFGVKRITKRIRRRVTDCLKVEVEEYDQYLRGAVYGFVVEKMVQCPTCGHFESEHVDSCWGFFGSDWQENGLFDHVGPEWAEALEVAT